MMNSRQVFWCLVLFPQLLFASGSEHIDPVASVIFWVTLIFFLGVVGRYLAMRLDQPGVLGELLMGVLVGNLCYFFGLPLAVILREGTAIFQIMRDLLASVPLPEAVFSHVPSPIYAKKLIAALSGPDGMDFLKVAYVVDAFSRYGVIFLLFLVGLESSVSQMRQTGRESLLVAVIGVVGPITLGLLVSFVLIPSAPFSAHLFVAATLSATSVGITARVLKEMNQLQTREAKTILGAAMMDDVLGLIILAIVTSLVINGIVSVLMIGKIILMALSFFAGALWIGPWVLRHAVAFFSFLKPWESKLFTAFLFVMCLSWIATQVQLAAIIGAFAAGIIIHDGFFDKYKSVGRETLAIKDLVAPLESLLAPLFFVLIGIQVKIETFLDWHVLLVAAGLIGAAILGKLVSGLGAARGDDRLLIGIGMLPRGEVGLVFASLGRTLNVISDDLFSAIILMVIVTTLVGPMWLKARVQQYAA
ncbi:MAG: cation:proton antiporter [Legionellales bacterium]|nr:cation:proton antiporter [Legionellales bacterium]